MKFWKQTVPFIMFWKYTYLSYIYSTRIHLIKYCVPFRFKKGELVRGDSTHLFSMAVCKSLDSGTILQPWQAYISLYEKLLLTIYVHVAGCFQCQKVWTTRIHRTHFFSMWRKHNSLRKYWPRNTACLNIAKSFHLFFLAAVVIF